MDALPQELIQEIVSRTSPAHASGKLSLLCSSFWSAAKSNLVWERFLPPDLIARRAVQDQVDYNDPWKNIDADTLRAFPNKKDLYLFLCDNPLYIDNGVMYTWLDKLSGNRCFHIGPQSLTLGHPDGWSGVHFWRDWRYNIIPCLDQGRPKNLEIEGKMSTSILSQNTTYTAYLLFNFTGYFYFKGFGKKEPLETFVGIDGYGESDSRLVYIPTDNPKYYKPDEPGAFIGPQYPVLRKDELYEIELGSYVNKEGCENRELRMSLKKVKSRRGVKSGISLYGIEILPESSVKTG
ncbi:F-box protein PP2-B11-like [Apium graveolens]|uniref:F-box protein PP2-B11-like n=1 Tax=Apium graveolens TaxID=4045 RepID=UPI003D79E5FB